MHRIFISLLLIISGPSFVFSQTTRTVLVEQFTGTWCGYCPYGADILENILSSMSNVRALAYHRSDAMATSVGNSLISALNQTSYPAAAIDRVLWSGQNKIPVTRSLWQSYTQSRSSVNSPMSISATGTFDVPTGALSLTVSLDALVAMTGEYRLNVVISEYDLNYSQKYYPPQGGSTTLSPYYHKHVVRDMITGYRGAELTTSGLPANWHRDTTITATLPSAWNILKSRITIFVSRDVIGTVKEIQQSMQDSFRNLLTFTPVTLISFLAEQDRHGVRLSWRTSRETNNRGWSIERSLDRFEWTNIDFVNGSGTTVYQQSYSCIDTDTDNSGTYFYRLRQVDFDGSEKLSPVAMVTISAVPKAVYLHQNYPNPCNSSTLIGYDIPAAQEVVLEICNQLGARIALLEKGTREAGRHYSEWDGISLSGEIVPSGTYSLILRTAGNVQTRQIAVVR